MDEEALKEHILKIHSDYFLRRDQFPRSYTLDCKICERKALTRGALLEHVEREHPRSRYALGAEDIKEDIKDDVMIVFEGKKIKITCSGGRVRGECSESL